MSLVGFWKWIAVHKSEDTKKDCSTLLVCAEAANDLSPSTEHVRGLSIRCLLAD